MQSIAKHLGRVELPGFTGTRVQMMPFLVHDPAGSLPAPFAPWLDLLSRISQHSGARGVGFITLDEAELRRGDYHRRPGLHVDCGGPLLAHGGAPPPPPKHGGSPPAPGPHGASSRRGGMYVVASACGSRGWVGEFPGEQADEGDCDGIRGALGRATRLEAGELYWANSHFVHETIPVTSAGPRQFLRVSMPSDSPWHADYTPNPLGVVPTGAIVGGRADFMNFRKE